MKFNEWLNEKAETYERMKVTSAKWMVDGNSPAIKETKAKRKIFASTTEAEAPTDKRSALSRQPLKCAICRESHSWDVAMCFVGRHIHRERKSSLITNFFGVYMGSTLSGSARNHARAPHKLVWALTTSCWTEPKEFSRPDLHRDRTLPPGVLPYRKKKGREKTRAFFPKLMLKDWYKFRKLNCSHWLELQMYLQYVNPPAVINRFLTD